MGLLDRLLGRRRLPTAAPPPATGAEAVARWKYLLVTAPPEVLAAAHADGMAALGAESRAEVLRRLRAALSALEPGAVIPSDAPLLLRAAARAERRAPGFLERAFTADPAGERALAGLATAVVATAVAAPFLRGFEPGLAAEALADRRAPDVEPVEGPPEMPGASGEHELDDED